MTARTFVRDADVIAQSDGWWHECAHRAVTWWAVTGQPFDAFDVTELGVPDPDVPQRWGALFRAASCEGLIEPIGYRQSRRRSRAGGVCRVWRGANAA